MHPPPSNRYGMYSGLLPLVVYSVTGTSRQLAVGPVAMVSLLVEVMLRDQLTPEECPKPEGWSGAQQWEYCPEAYAELAFLAAFMVGLFQVRMGWGLGEVPPGRGGWVPLEAQYREGAAGRCAPVVRGWARAKSTARVSSAGWTGGRAARAAGGCGATGQPLPPVRFREWACAGSTRT
eukprot:scaffold13996_cov124-Isochrysis_galbana.AAC.1